MLGRRRQGNETRWELDNRVSLNPWPFLVLGGAVSALVGLGVLIWLV